MTEIQLFNNGEFELRVFPQGDSFLVSGPGLARALCFRDAHAMVRNLPADEKGSHLEETPGGSQQVWFVTEPGFYHVVGQRQPGRIKDAVLRARVERFQRWVHHEVLPAIRRTGGYQVPQQRQPVAAFGTNVSAPDVFTYDEVCAVLRQFFGVALTVNELTRNLRAGGLLKQNGAPTKRYAHLFWFTGSAWCIQAHVIPQVAFKVYETGREMQDWRFLQTRLQIDGVGGEPRLDSHDRRSLGA